MEPECTLFVYPRDAIMLAVRLETTVASFYQDDGVTSFMARLASVLGVHAADLKVVQVFEGSAIVQAIVRSDSDEVDETTGLTPLEQLKTIETTFIEKATTGVIGEDLGAPVKQVLTDEGKIVPTPGNEDLSDLASNSQFMELFETF